jgi:ribonucleoside-diphosphate reductase alpha chain
MDTKLESLERRELNFERFFTQAGRSPYEFDILGYPIKWITEDVKVNDDAGKLVFVQPNVERPDFWSSLAIKVVASKYFWGDIAKGERENSVRKLVGRVAKYIERQALKQKYFNQDRAKTLNDEIAAICLNQIGAFNSPVWFNAGIMEYNKNAGGISHYRWDSALQKVVKALPGEDFPQGSACFILSVEDNMDSIMALQVAEANIFKAGSGTGVNRSTLRSCKEKLTGGGRASGPMSFLKGADAYAGIIKSGGKTRRAAKMEILNTSHPDILQFIEAKQNEEKKAWALIESGYDGGLNGEAYGSVAYQNCNFSVRATDDFMDAVKRDAEWQTKFVKTGEPCETFRAKDILRKIAEGTHLCGDPGMQFDTTFNKWHTCKNSGRINATNPCSEFAMLDDSACNLASLNLMKFKTKEGLFDVEGFKRAIRNFIIAMDLIVDGGSYPTEKVAFNSHQFRPLGLGYANLGALLMSWGLPYDSDEGRNVAAAITAIMTGEAYKMSAELARAIGQFAMYEKNKEPMLEVIKMHRDAVKKIDVTKMPANLRYLTSDAWDSWTDALEYGEKYGYRNAQVTVMAPTGTIAFLMDCDTTGVEPDIALVKYKVLAGGGMLKIVNRAVPEGLRVLGYTEEQASRILNYIDQNDMIEGAPDMREEHLRIFDCAFKPAKGKRSIHYSGHIKMMAAVQPFLSGSISKTINMPENATITEIEEAYIYAWELGLKCVAIYRENSKRSQPLNTKKTEKEVTSKKVELAVKERKRMPQTRRSLIHKFDIADHEGFLIVGLYDDGKPGEMFITMSKQGSTIRGLMDAWATSVSLNLQYGASVGDLFGKFRHQKFEPSGFVRNINGGEIDSKMRQIRIASSIVDYVAQFMLANFGEGSGGVSVNMNNVSTIASPQPQASLNPSINVGAVPNSGASLSPLTAVGAAGGLLSAKEEQASIKDFGNEGLICPHCGGPAKRLGNCAIFCTSCKQTTRSGCGE